MIPKISVRKLKASFNAMLHVKYRLGAKAAMNAKPQNIKEIDCSGAVRYWICQATDDLLVIPDGSWNQRDWCEKAGLRKLDKYSDVQYAAEDPSRLFIAFVKPVYLGKKLLKAGHVWLVWQGMTMESHGGKGVNSRHWNLAFTKLRKAEAYELPTKS